MIERKRTTIGCWKDERRIFINVHGYEYRGLVLHASIGSAKGHTITHIKDSVAIHQNIFHSHKLRLEILKELAELIDWDVPFSHAMKTIRVNKKLYERYNELLAMLAPGKEISSKIVRRF